MSVYRRAISRIVLHHVSFVLPKLRKWCCVYILYIADACHPRTSPRWSTARVGRSRLEFQGKRGLLGPKSWKVQSIPFGYRNRYYGRLGWGSGELRG